MKLYPVRIKYAWPAELDLMGRTLAGLELEVACRFQTIWEGCGFYETDVGFLDILRRRRDDATAHADALRTKLYDDLVKIIDITS